MRVLVTGGAGYIGSHTAKMLAHRGMEPVVLDSLGMGHRWAVKWGPLVEGNLADAELIRRVLADYRIEAVVHFAASAYVGESMHCPREYFDNNVRNSLNLLDAMRDGGVDCLIFSSSCATYGVPESVTIPEEHPQKPVNPYGESKLMVERMLHWFRQAYGFRSIALRYFNAAGCDPEGEIGESHDPETHLIPLVLAAGLGQRPALDIFGTDYPTPDGTAIRDYIHVQDLATAHCLALEHLLSGGSAEALNLGTGRGYSVREVIRTAEQILKVPVPVRECPRRAGDPPVLVADSRRAVEVLGWRPGCSGLESIVATALAWQRSQHFSPST